MGQVKIPLLILSACAMSACSMEGVKESKSACISEIQEKLGVDVTNAPSGWSSYAGTGGKGTTFTFNQTATTPGVICKTSGGKVISLTKSETTVIQ